MVVVKRTKTLSKNELYNLAVEYNQLSKMQKDLDKRKKVIADTLKDNADKVATADDKGSYYVDEFPLIFGKMAKHSVKLNEEKAREFFTQKGILESILSTKEFVDEAKIEKILGEEIISVEDLAEFMDDKVSYSVFVAEKAEKEEETEATPPEVKEVSNKKKVFKKK